MTCREWKQRFLAWQRVSEAAPHDTSRLPDDLARHLKECPRCRIVPEALAGLAPRGRQASVPPPSLNAAVMAAVRERHGRVRYRRFPIPVLAAPLAAVAGLVLLLLFSGLRSETDDASVTVKLLLNAPHAKTVAVVGDWNSWDPAGQTLSDPDGDGVWEIVVRLHKDREYRYQFILDGESWIPDPLAPLHVQDGFGGINSVLDI